MTRLSHSAGAMPNRIFEGLSAKATIGATALYSAFALVKERISPSIPRIIYDSYSVSVGSWETLYSRLPMRTRA